MDVRIGKVKGFRGNWMSGIAYLIIEDSESHVIENVPCDNGATVRALEGAFGNVIGEGHTVNNGEDAGYYDREIYWTYDDMGLMIESFTPVEEASAELVGYFNQERGIEVCLN